MDIFQQKIFAYQSEDETKEVCVGGKAFANFGYDNHADNYNTAIVQMEMILHLVW